MNSSLVLFYPAARSFYVLIFYVHEYFAYLYISAPNVFLVLLETRIGCEIPYKSYRQMWAPCGCGELIPGLLEEQSVLLPADQPLHPFMDSSSIPSPLSYLKTYFDRFLLNFFDSLHRHKIVYIRNGHIQMMGVEIICSLSCTLDSIHKECPCTESVRVDERSNNKWSIMTPLPPFCSSQVPSSHPTMTGSSQL